MTRLIGSLAAVVLVLAACGSSTPDDGGGGGGATPDPAIAFCNALDSYGATLAEFEALTPDSTVEEYQAAGADARAALVALTAVAGPFAGAQIADLTTAQTILNAAVDQLPPNATPAMAELALDPAVKGVIQEVAATHNASCNFRPTPSAS